MPYTVTFAFAVAVCVLAVPGCTFALRLFTRLFCGCSYGYVTVGSFRYMPGYRCAVGLRTFPAFGFTLVHGSRTRCGYRLHGCCPTFAFVAVRSSFPIRFSCTVTVVRILRLQFCVLCGCPTPHIAFLPLRCCRLYHARLRFLVLVTPLYNPPVLDY